MYRRNNMQMAILSAVMATWADKDYTKAENYVLHDPSANTNYKHAYRFTRDGMMHCPLPYVKVPDDVRRACIAESKLARLYRFRRQMQIHRNSPTIFINSPIKES